MHPLRRTALSFALCLALVLTLAPGFPHAVIAQARPVPTPDATIEGQPANQPLRPPEMRARAAILMDARSGLVLYQKNAWERIPVASLTKMVTALVAVERAPLDLRIEATEYVRSVPSVIGLDPGDVLTLEQLLYGLILRSGNDAALDIAEALGGGSGPAAIESFVALMNGKARDLGLFDTSFVNPNGLDAPGHLSTAFDMAQIARSFMRHPDLARIAAAKRYEIAGPPLWVFQNLNGFLYTYQGADGIKTGFEDLAGRCLAASAARDGRRLISVVLNSDHYVEETARLMDYGFATYPTRRVDPSWLRSPA
jgi:D-alanyl-D-alanine carboxypeptidase